MMDERFIYLLEKKLDESLEEHESSEFENLISKNDILKIEYSEQLKVKEALNKMRMINPSKETWDNYWLSVYNRIERKIAWIAIIIGSLMVFSIAAMEAVESFLKDTDTPTFVKYGMVIVIFGLLLLFFSVVREKFFTSKKDKYKEVQR